MQGLEIKESHGTGSLMSLSPYTKLAKPINVFVSTIWPMTKMAGTLAMDFRAGRSVSNESVV